MKNLITLTCKYTTLLLLVPSLLYAASVWAAAPPSGEVSANQQQATWTGGPLIATAAATCNGPDNPSCDNFALTITAPTFPFQVQISITASAADDWDLEVYDPSGVLIGTSANGAGSVETVVLNNPASGTYTVSVSPFAPVGPYTGAANLEPVGGGGGGGAVEAGNLPILNYGPPGASGDDPDYQLFGPVAGEQGLGLGAGEPTTGIPIVNNLDLQLTDPDLTRQMYISGLETLRVTYNDCTVPAVALWEDKSVPTHATTLDPILNVDSATGRTFSSQLAGKTSLLSFSDDDGENWAPSQGAGINSGVDHQSIGGGPFSVNDPIGPITAYPNAVYYASQDISTAQAALSRDGGQTFGAAVPMYNISQCGGLHGHIEVDTGDGTVYVPNKNCGGEEGYALSEDSGTTWTVRTVPGTQSSSSDPSIGVASDGTTYLGMCNGGNTALIAISEDKGQNWTTPVDVGAPFGIVNCAFPEVIAGDGDRAAFAFLGTSTPGAGTDANPDFDGAWFMYLAVTYDRGATWETSVVTPGDPVQRGAVCLSGTTCESGRNLLDFNDIEIDEKGRILIAYSDGCVGGCVNGSNNSGTDVARIARQQRGGRGLLAEFDDFMLPSVPQAPDSPFVEAANFVDTNQLKWSRPFDGGAPIMEYQIFRREGADPFPAAPLAIVPADQTTFTDDSLPMAGGDFFYQILAVNNIAASRACFEAAATAPVILDPCTLPGVQRANDASGDQTGGTQLDVEKLFLAEPFFGDPLQCGVPSEQKLVFNLNIGDPTLATTNNTWVILWNRAVPILTDDGLQTYDRNMVNMRITATGPECHFGLVTAPSVNQGDDRITLPIEDCQLKDNGELTIRIATSDINDCEGAGCPIGPGYSLDGLEVRTYASNVSGQLVSQGTSNDFSTALSYTLFGNEACRLNAVPIANDDQVTMPATPQTLNVFPLGNDVAGDCDTLTVTSAGPAEFGTVTVTDGLHVKYEPMQSFNGEDVFQYTDSDGNGNTANATITVIQSVELIFIDGFESQ